MFYVHINNFINWLIFVIFILTIHGLLIKVQENIYKIFTKCTSSLKTNDHTRNKFCSPNRKKYNKIYINNKHYIFYCIVYTFLSFIYFFKSNVIFFFLIFCSTTINARKYLWHINKVLPSIYISSHYYKELFD